MDELQISGKRFISARRIARDNGYTSDYIGQLIRGSKITGQKVGRAWYVDVASFDAYLQTGGVSVVAPVVPEVVVASIAAIAPVVEKIILAKVEVEEVEISAPVVVEAVEQEIVPPAVMEEEPTLEIKIKKIPEPVFTRMHSEVTHHIPLRIFKKADKVDMKEVSAGLRYYADDAPALPEIPSYKKESRILVVDSAAAQEEAATAVVKTKRGTRFMLGGLIMSSVAIFIFCALVSSAVSLNLSISEGNTAATSYSINW